MKVINIWFFFLLVLSVLITVGCNPQLADADSVIGLGSQSVEVSPTTSSGGAITETLVFSLQSSVVDRHMVYVGVGGDIDGLINPDLIVPPGVRVHVSLINGDGIPHDIAFPNFGTKSALVSSKGETSEVSFDINEDQIGTYAYFCTQPGHRQAGQEGQLIVGEP